MKIFLVVYVHCKVKCINYMHTNNYYIWCQSESTTGSYSLASWASHLGNPWELNNDPDLLTRNVSDANVQDRLRSTHPGNFPRTLLRKQFWGPEIWKNLKFHKEVSQQSGIWQAWRKKSRADHQCNILFLYFEVSPFLFILLSCDRSPPQLPLFPLLPVIPTSPLPQIHCYSYFPAEKSRPLRGSNQTQNNKTP